MKLSTSNQIRKLVTTMDKTNTYYREDYFTADEWDELEVAYEKLLDLCLKNADVEKNIGTEVNNIGSYINQHKSKN